MVVTDWGGSNDRVQGIVAGNHLEMPATKGNNDRDIMQDVKDGRITMYLLDTRLEELYSFGLSITTWISSAIG